MESGGTNNILFLFTYGLDDYVHILKFIEFIQFMYFFQGILHFNKKFILKLVVYIIKIYINFKKVEFKNLSK